MMNNTKTPSNHYSAMLYALSDEIRSEEGCVTESADNVESAAERIDEQTVTINVLVEVLRKARLRIAEDRDAVFSCHVNVGTGVIDDAYGQTALANYDEVLRQIDNLLSVVA